MIHYRAFNVLQISKNEDYQREGVLPFIYKIKFSNTNMRYIRTVSYQLESGTKIQTNVYFHLLIYIKTNSKNYILLTQDSLAAAWECLHTILT